MSLRDFIDAPRLSWDETKQLLKARDSKGHQVRVLAPACCCLPRWSQS